MTNHLFPRYHVRPPTGYVNDPNGPILIDGLVHLYYQYRHAVDQSLPVLWGHATSADFAHWEHHRPAIAPHPLRGDRDGCWSGNTVVDDHGRVRAFYSGRVAGEPLQRTLSAVSHDGGYSFTAPRQVVGQPDAGEQIETLRDPFVWRHGASWRMVVGAGTATGTAAMLLYTSDDLSAWTYLGPLAQMPRTRTSRWDSGTMWECPQIIRAGGELVALVGSWAPNPGIMSVLSFSLPADDGKCEIVDPAALHLVDDGPNFYAASALNDTPDGALVWGWATEGRSPQWCEADGWSGMLTLPRLVTPRAGGGLASEPHPGLAALRSEPAGRPLTSVLDGVGAQFEFLLAVAGDTVLTLTFGTSEHLVITVDYHAGEVRVDREHASADPRADGGVVTVGGLDELRSPAARLHGYFDGSILELFLPGGRVATTRCYPSTPPPWRLELTGTASPSPVRVWELAGPPGAR